MSAENLRTGAVRLEKSRDPRAQLAQKYFTLRPQPLERWLWGQGIPPAAERVFWLHWHEGMKRGDWCSELPLKRVARDCHLDVSTVTRAYQWLVRAGCVRRTDPGRDPANPFSQATAITEVRVPRELLTELDRHPNRGANRRGEGRVPVGTETAETAAFHEGHATAAAADPFAGQTGRDRLRSLSSLTRLLSAEERRQYDEALRLRRAHLTFDAESALSPEDRAKVLQQLSAAATVRSAARVRPPAAVANAASSQARQLSTFELARLRRDIQAATSSTAAPELARQVAWSVEEGALRRFGPLLATRIALKKIREGRWTRPNRMPPNWSRG